MADTVQYLMEQMVPELEDLERRGLFKKAEIKQIVKKRQDFEYLLKRRRALKEDYLRYIEYETKLEALRKHRKEVIVKQLQADNARVRWRSSLSDHAITRRIMFIYERASRKFKGDLSLWLQYLEYCRSKSGTRQMQKVLTKALQLHPGRPALWIYVAAWEFETNQNASAARSLMQRGLRMCPKSEQLWLEYLRMELTYAERLKARREVLGLNEQTDGPDAKRRKLGAGILLEENSEERSKQAGASGSDLDKFSYKVAAATFQNTIASIPDSLELRTRFLEVIEKFDFEGREKLADEVYASIGRNFAASEEGLTCLAWRWLREQRLGYGQGARMSPGEARSKTVEAFQEALKAKRSSQMAEAYAGFLEDSIHDLQKETEAGGASLTESVDLLLAHLEDCRESGLSSEPMAERHVALLLQRSSASSALGIASKYCEAQFKASARLWELRLGLEMRCSANENSADGEELLDQLFAKAFKAVPVLEVVPLWTLAVQRVAVRRESEARILGEVSACLQSATGKEGESLACAMLDWMVVNKGLAAAREFYTRLLSFPGPGRALFQKCIQLESLPTSSEGDMAQLRPLFEAALQVHGQAWELWLEYCKLELQGGHSHQAAAVHWRAKKVLHDPAPFFDAYKNTV